MINRNGKKRIRNIIYSNGSEILTIGRYEFALKSLWLMSGALLFEKYCFGMPVLQKRYFVQQTFINFSHIFSCT